MAIRNNPRLAAAPRLPEVPGRLGFAKAKNGPFSSDPGRPAGYHAEPGTKPEGRNAAAGGGNATAGSGPGAGKGRNIEKFFAMNTPSFSVGFDFFLQQVPFFYLGKQ